ncbi:MAG: DUF3866 family protein [Actinomycetota bacterium]|nr:DUF3866 family protein [Actinomycetota bacterium]
MKSRWISTAPGGGVAVNYNDLTRPVAVGDPVAVNTTAVELALGSGGRHSQTQ